MSITAAGTITERTTNVSSSTPKATMKPICVRDHQRQHRERAERPRQHEAGAGDHRAGDREPAQRALARAVALRLLAHARHQEDVVVDPQRDEEDEGQQRQRRPDAGEAEDVLRDEDAGPERRGEGHDHRDDQQQRSDDRAQQHDEDREHDEQRQRDDQAVVARGGLAQVELLRRRAADQHGGAARAARRLAQRGDLIHRRGGVRVALERDLQLDASRGPRRPGGRR